MYKKLWTNTPKECQEIPDYSYDQHFGKPVSSYLDRVEAGSYIIARAKAKKLHKFIKFNHTVTSVNFDSSTETFKMTIQDSEGKTIQYQVDYLVVATGHFWKPNEVTLNGQESFKGTVMHSHDYRDGRLYKGQNVLCVGTHYSGEDIGLQCLKFGASSVTLSYHTNPTGHKWPKGITEKPPVTQVSGSTVTFRDTTTQEIDTIIFCTGFVHYYPYLDSSLKLNEPNSLYPPGLYKGVIWQKNPKVFYIGAQDQIFSFPMFDAQSAYIRDIVLGTTSVPDEQSRQTDIQSWLSKLGKIGSLNDAIDFQAAHLKDLLENSSYIPIKTYNVEAQANLFKEWLVDKMMEIATMRDLRYKSSITGTLGCKPAKTWDEDLDTEEWAGCNDHLKVEE